MNFVAIIPARYASTRFPGKPLAMLGDKSVIQRVYEQVTKQLPACVATDDERIYEHVKSFGGNVVMTRTDHKSGTDRIEEAVEKLCSTRELNISNDTVIVNVQGDEPFIQPEQIKTLCECFNDKATDIATLGIRFKNLEAVKNPNSPKIILDNMGFAMYFSRSVIPYIRGKEETESGFFISRQGKFPDAAVADHGLAVGRIQHDDPVFILGSPAESGKMDRMEFPPGDLSVRMFPFDFPSFRSGPSVFDPGGDFAHGEEPDAEPVRIRIGQPGPLQDHRERDAAERQCRTVETPGRAAAAHPDCEQIFALPDRNIERMVFRIEDHIAVVRSRPRVHRNGCTILPHRRVFSLPASEYPDPAPASAEKQFSFSPVFHSSSRTAGRPDTAAIRSEAGRGPVSWP